MNVNNFFLNFWKWFSIIVLIAAFGLLVQLAVWMWYPYNIIEFTKLCCNPDGSTFEGLVLNEDKKVKKGNFLHVQIEYNKKINIPTSKITRELMNDRYVTLVTHDTSFFPPGCQKKTLLIYIPENMWPGTYRLSNTFQYHPNPIRTINVKWESEWFEVIN